MIDHKHILMREQIIKKIRTFFDEQHFHEIITPVLNRTIPTEENNFPFTTQWQTIDGTEQYFLPTSPEKNLKEVLALGVGNCYSIGHSFRNLEMSGPRHTPEFLMLEWYRENATYRDIMIDVISLISTIIKQEVTWQTLSLVDLFHEYCNLEMEDIVKGDQLSKRAKQKGYNTEHASWSELFDQIFLNEIYPKLPKTPFFLIDFPSRT